MDTIPIEDLVDQTKSFIISYGTDLIMAEILVVTGPFGGFFGPIISAALKKAINWIVTELVNNFDKAAFNINMDLLTSSQAQDYRNSVAKLIQAPDNISDADWENLENEANENFKNLVGFTS